MLRRGACVKRAVHGVGVIHGERGSGAALANRLGAVWRRYDEGGATVINEYDFKGVPQITARRLITFVAERDPDTAEFWDCDSDWSAIAAATTEAAIDTADAAAALETTTWSSQSLVDALGRPYLTETPTAAGGVPVVQHLQYDGGGALAEIEVTDRASTQTQVHGLRYNARGQRTQVEHGNGVTTTFTYDPETFRLTRQVAERSDASKLQDLRLTWGPAGQIYAIRDGIQTLVYYDNAITHPERQFVYDARGRLIRATGREHDSTYGLDPAAVPGTPCSIPGPANEVSGYIRDYEWDAAGNMTELSVVGGWTRSLVYESGSNRLTSFTWSASSTTNDVKYDQFGQLEGLPSAKDLRWDGDGNLRYSSPLTTGATSRTWYVYSGAQRVRKVTEQKDGTNWHIAKETVYLDGGFEVYRTYDAPGTLVLEREHVRITDGAGHALEIETVLVEGGSAVSTITPLYRYALVDQIGSVSVELDDNAAVVSYEEYYPFGTTSYYGDTRGAQAKRYRYSGKEQDAETGLYYYGYRYYAPGAARWTAPDPAGTVDGLNLFPLVQSSPVHLADTAGLSSKGNPRITNQFDIDDVPTEVYEEAGSPVFTDENGQPDTSVYPGQFGGNIINLGPEIFVMPQSDPLQENLIRRYASGAGDRYHLTANEARTVAPDQITVTQTLTGRDRHGHPLYALNEHWSRDVQQLLEQGGGSMDVRYRLQAQATSSTTLGGFTMHYVGRLYVDSATNEWAFEGHLRMYDVWDFNPEGSRRGDGADSLVRIVNNFLRGTPFEVTSDWMWVSEYGQIDVERSTTVSELGQLNRVGYRASFVSEAGLPFGENEEGRAIYVAPGLFGETGERER